MKKLFILLGSLAFLTPSHGMEEQEDNTNQKNSCTIKNLSNRCVSLVALVSGLDTTKPTAIYKVDLLAGENKTFVQKNLGPKYEAPEIIMNFFTVLSVKDASDHGSYMETKLDLSSGEEVYEITESLFMEKGSSQKSSNNKRRSKAKIIYDDLHTDGGS